MLWILRCEEVFNNSFLKPKNVFCGHPISNIVSASLILKISVITRLHSPALLASLAPTEMKDLAYLLALYSNWTIFCSMLLMFLE